MWNSIRPEAISPQLFFVEGERRGEERGRRDALKGRSGRKIRAKVLLDMARDRLGSEKGVHAKALGHLMDGGGEDMIRAIGACREQDVCTRSARLAEEPFKLPRFIASISFGAEIVSFDVDLSARHGAKARHLFDRCRAIDERAMGQRPEPRKAFEKEWFAGHLFVF